MGRSRACTKMHPMANGQSNRSILLDWIFMFSSGDRSGHFLILIFFTALHAEKYFLPFTFLTARRRMK